MLTYTSAELCAFDHDRPPLRSVRKSLFANHLWRPARQRRRAARPCSVTSGADVNKPTRCLSADRRSMLIGWLNVQSLSASKLDAVGELIVDRSLDVLALCETWHSSSDDARLRLAIPAGVAIRRRRCGPSRWPWRRCRRCLPEASEMLADRTAALRHFRGAVCPSVVVRRHSYTDKYLPTRLV